MTAKVLSDAIAEHGAGHEFCRDAEYDECVPTSIDLAEFIESTIPFGKHDQVYIERTITWQDTPTGLVCKARPDILVVSEDRSHAHVIDIKCAIRSIREHDFRRQAENGYYHAQMAHYLTGARLGTTRPDNRELADADATIAATIVAYQPSDLDMHVFDLDPGDLDDGENLMREWIDAIAVGQSTHHWPGVHAAPRSTLQIVQPGGFDAIPTFNNEEVDADDASNES
jgi:hypothetical protein